MAGRLTELPETNSNHDMILGEMRGQLREVVHAVNNLSQNVTALTREVSGLGSLAIEVAELKTNCAGLSTRIGTLETERSMRQGRDGVLHTMLRSPTLAWIVAAAVAAWVTFKERTGL